VKEYKRNKEIIHGKHTKVRKFLHINKINKKEKTALRNLIKTKKDKLIKNDTRQKYE